MSTDSTELTFVRCPSCRSLVPAISTRCRMCGATLEASAVPESSDQDQRKSGRVRQRTMSEAAPEVAVTAQQVREESPPPPPPPQPKVIPVAPPVAPVIAASVKEADPIEDLEDPLSAYIEEVEMKDDSAAHVMAVEPHEEEEEAIEEDEEKLAPIQMKRETPAPASPPPSFDDDDSDDEVDLLAALDDEPEDVAPPPKPAPTPPRVVVESGSRKPGGKSQLGFSAPREQTALPQAKVEAERPKPQVPQGSTGRSEVREEKPRQEARPPQQPQQQQPRKEAQPQQQQSRPQNQGNQQQRQQPQQPQQQPPRRDPRPEQPQQQQQQQNRPRPPQESRPHENKGAPREQNREQPRESREERPQQNVQQPTRAPVAPFNPGASKSEAAAGRLFGWLVNYTDPDGAAVEVREGKFFVSAKSVKPTDLVIDDKTISSPHALLTVSPGTGLTVQDLMSERGVFVRRKGSDTYKKEEETVSVTHGEWVRFGDVEFLVSLIAHPGEV